MQGRIQDFKLGGGVLKKIAPSGGRREHFWGISCENSRFYAKKADYRISLLPLTSNSKNKTVMKILTTAHESVKIISTKWSMHISHLISVSIFLENFDTFLLIDLLV
jgi:hypothetical protein